MLIFPVFTASHKILILGLLLLSISHNAAALGDPNLDETFGDGGYRRLTFDGYAYSWNFGSFVSPLDQKITLIGNACGGFYDPCSLALGRYDANGNPDPAFGVNGKLITSHFAATGGFALPDGKFIVFGGNNNDWRNGLDLQVSRLNSDGSLDRRFAQNGTFAVSLDGSRERVIDGILLADGKMLFIGDKDFSSRRMVLFRLNSDGRLDLTFGTNGVIDYDHFPENARLTLQPDGKIITPSYDRVLRFLPDGSLDPTFTSNRIFELAANFTVAVGLQSDGKIIVTGKNTQEQIWMGGYGGLFITRLNPDGTRDATFKNGGAFKTSFGRTFYGSTPDRLLVLPSDDILIGGHDGQSNGLSLFTKDGEYISKTISRRFDPQQAGSSVGMWLQPGGKVLTAGGGVSRYKTIKYFADVNIRYNYSGIGSAEQSNLGVYRPSAGLWFFGAQNGLNATLGSAGDIPVPADYDGDNRTDHAVFRPSDGTWRTLNTTVQFGQSGDIPVPGDFDGDGRYDRAVFRPSNGMWNILLSSGQLLKVQFGISGDQPVTGDFDNDGRSDIAVLRRTQGQMIWYIYRSASSDLYVIPFGLDSDIALTFDFASDGQTDICIFRPSTGDWWVYQNLTGIYVVHWGRSGDIPAPLYYDSDKLGDFVIYRPSNNYFYILSSQTGPIRSVQVGDPGDIPITSVYNR